MENEIVCRVWQRAKTPSGFEAGMFLIKDGRFSYRTKDGELVNIPVGEIKGQSWPWLGLGYAFNMMVNGKEMKFSFMEPPREATTEIDLIKGVYSYNYNFIKELYGEDWLKIFYPANESDKAVAKKWRKLLGG